MLLHIRHSTVYHYSRPVENSMQVVRLTPRRDPWQRTQRWTLVTPGQRIEQVDAFGNLTHLVRVEEPLTELKILAHGIVDTSEAEGTVPGEEGGVSPLVFLASTRLTQPDAAVETFAARFRGALAADQAALLELAEAVRSAVVWEQGTTDVEHTAGEALALGRGVCQDHAHLFASVGRLIGVPVRYVSGYFNSGHASAASHAWVDAWRGPELGWLSIDVTQGELAGPRHCRLAVGRDYQDAGPVRGVRRGGGDERLEVAVQVAGSSQEQQ